MSTRSRRSASMQRTTICNCAHPTNRSVADRLLVPLSVALCTPTPVYYLGLTAIMPVTPIASLCLRSNRHWFNLSSSKAALKLTDKHSFCFPCFRISHQIFRSCVFQSAVLCTWKTSGTFREIIMQNTGAVEFERSNPGSF